MNEDLGAEVYLYRPGGSPAFEDLTDDIGPGFGNPLTKYAWSA